MPEPGHGPASRRSFLRTTGGALGGTALAARFPGLAEAAGLARRMAAGVLPPSLKTLTVEEAAEVEGLSALIIPTDDTPGAREAGAVYFIDQVLAGYFASLLDPFRDGLSDFGQRLRDSHPDATSIHDLSPSEAVEFVRSIEDDGFLRACRDLTVMAMFANPEYGGNRDRSGWEMIGFDDRHAWQPPFGWYDAEVMGEDP